MRLRIFLCNPTPVVGCWSPLPNVLLRGRSRWRNFYCGILCLMWRGSVSVLDTGPSSVACIANIFSNNSKLETLPSEASSTRIGTNPRKVTNTSAVGLCSPQTPGCGFLLGTLQCPGTPDAENHHEGPGSGTSTAPGVLTAIATSFNKPFYKRGAPSLQPVNPDIQTPQSEAKNKLKVRPHCHVEGCAQGRTTRTLQSHL